MKLLIDLHFDSFSISIDSKRVFAVNLLQVGVNCCRLIGLMWLCCVRVVWQRRRLRRCCWALWWSPLCLSLDAFISIRITWRRLSPHRSATSPLLLFCPFLVRFSTVNYVSFHLPGNASPNQMRQLPSAVFLFLPTPSFPLPRSRNVLWSRCGVCPTPSPLM